MHCNKHEARIDQLIDGLLDYDQIEKLKQDVIKDQCADCLAIIDNHQMLMEQSENWQDEEVPSWNRASHVVSPKKETIHWANWASMAFSSLALLLVVTQFEVHSTEHGLLFSFAGQGQERIIAQRVEDTLQNIQAQQKDYIDAKLVNFSNAQAEKNLQVINAVVELNRTERRQEMVKFASFLDNKNKRDLYNQRNNAVNYQPIDQEALDSLNDDDLIQPKGSN